jgi:hypothetical protein
MPSRTRARKNEEDDDSDDDEPSKPAAAGGDPGKYGLAASSVTLSGLLNAIDGVASQVGIATLMRYDNADGYRRTQFCLLPPTTPTDSMMRSSDLVDSMSMYPYTMPYQPKLPSSSSISTHLRSTKSLKKPETRRKETPKALPTKKTSIPMPRHLLPTSSIVELKSPWLLCKVSCSGTRNIPRKLWLKLRLGRKR